MAEALAYYPESSLSCKSKFNREPLKVMRIFTDCIYAFRSKRENPWLDSRFEKAALDGCFDGSNRLCYCKIEKAVWFFKNLSVGEATRMFEFTP